jgi:hypothetical protein
MLILEHIFGLSFLMVGLVAMTSYNEEMKRWQLPLFYEQLKPMQERWGHATGTALHFLAYVLPPFGFGILFLMGLVF